MVVQDESLKRLVQSRYLKLKEEKINFERRMQDIADYVCPYRDDISGTLQKGLQKGKKVYDSTAVSAAILATDGIHGYHVSPSFPWFNYAMNRPAANKIPSVKAWLQELEELLYMALNRSNFYSEIWNFIYDGFTIGTAVEYSEEDLTEECLVFETVHPGEVYISDNKYGKVDVLFRNRKINVRNLIQRFGKENFPKNVLALEENSPFTEFDVLHSVFPRDDYSTNSKLAKDKKYASIWLLTQGNHILKVSGFDKFPYSVWRYLKTGKEAYGISPAHIVLSDIKSLNLINKTLLGAAQMAVDPPYNIPTILKGKVQLQPRGKNYIDDPNHKITPVNTGRDFPVGVDREQAKQAAIKEVFHVDTFLMLSQLGGRGQRTATEINEMMSEKAAILGAELGPLNTVLDNILDRVYDLEEAGGRLPPIPDELLALAEEDPYLRFDPEYQGPLATSQRERFGKNPYRSFFTDIGPVIEVNQESLDNFDFDKIARSIADVSGFPADEIKDEEVVAKERQAKLEALQQQAQTEEALEGAKTVSEIDRNMGGKVSDALIENKGLQNE